MAHRRLRSIVLRLAPPVALFADVPLPEVDGEKPAIPERKWIQVASEGSYKGHADGKFELNRAVFTEFVTALHADPRFLAGADGVGTNPVLPFDYEHVSEMDPREGSVPEKGAPAPAWVLDLRVQSAADGKAQLWAFAQLGQQIREQMGRDEYRFVSIAFVLESTDPVSAKPAGAQLTSIAFTNHPFLRDLVPIAARRHGLSAWYGDQAASPEEAFEFTRTILQLPAVSTNEDVIGELAKVVAWAGLPDSAPAGVDVGDIMTDLRRAWGVPVTSTSEDLLQTARVAAAQLLDPNAPAPAPVPPPPPISPPVVPATGLKEPNMSENLQKKLVALFHTKRGVTMLDSEEAIASAVDAAISDAMKLGDILKALGHESANAALEGIPDLLAAKKKLTDALAQLEEALTMQAQVDEATESTDVAAAMSAKGYGDDEQLKVALRSHRSSVIAEGLKALPANPGPKQLSDGRKAARRAFLTSYGVAPEGQEALLMNLVAAPGGAQLKPPVAAPGGRNLGIPKNLGAKVIQLAGLPGANRTARLCNWVKNNDPNGKDLTWAQVNTRADQLKNDPNVTIEDGN